MCGNDMLSKCRSPHAIHFNAACIFTCGDMYRDMESTDSQRSTAQMLMDTHPSIHQTPGLRVAAATAWEQRVSLHGRPFSISPALGNNNNT